MVDPFRVNEITKASKTAGDKVTAVEAVATVASVINNNMGEEAIKVADAQAAKASMVVSGDAIAKLALSSPEQSSSSQKANFQKYVVLDGDTLWSIARKFSVTTDSIKWSNKMSDEDFVKPGQELLIPSITGIIYTVKAGDSIEGIASRYKASAKMITDQNNLYGEDIKAGMVIIIPDGSVDEPVSTPTPATSPTNSRLKIAGTTKGSVPSSIASSSGPNRFPWGYCTWWVAHKRYIPWNGNAWQWYGNAIAYGRPVGKKPVAGAVMVTWESPIGHVAYVESVNGNSFTVSEMNYVGYGRVSTRTVTTSSVPLIGFIY